MLTLPRGWLVVLGAMLVAAFRTSLLHGYTHPRGLAAAGALVALVMAALGVYTLVTQVPLLVR